MTDIATVSNAEATAAAVDAARRGEGVAVLVPCYNEAPTIAKVVADFRAQLPEAELLVVDNASTDGSVQLLQSYERRGVKAVRLTACGGPLRARLEGARRARGDEAGRDAEARGEGAVDGDQGGVAEAHPGAEGLGARPGDGRRGRVAAIVVGAAEHALRCSEGRRRMTGGSRAELRPSRLVDGKGRAARSWISCEGFRQRQAFD